MDDGKKYYRYPDTITAAVGTKVKTETKGYWDDTEYDRYYVYRKCIFWKKGEKGTLDLNKLNHRTVWVAARFVTEVIYYERQKIIEIECKLTKLLGLIHKMQNVLQYFYRKKSRNAAIAPFFGHKCNLKF